MEISSSISKSVSSSTRTDATGSTTTSTRPLSVDELTDVRDTLKGPASLTDRSVLIPFGGKAFLPGRLAPLLLPNHDNDESCHSNAVRTSIKRSSDDWKEQETVVVHDVNIDFISERRSNNEAEMTQTSHVMTRQEALDYLQKEIDRLQKKPSNRPTQTTGSTNRLDAEDRTKQSALNIENDALPFIEIREELDETGHVTNTQAVNVTHHLQYLSQQQQDMQHQAQKRESTTNDNCVTPEMIDSVSSGTHSDDGTNIIDKTHIDPNAEATTSLPVRAEFSNEHYDTIFRRLDELMLLEEKPEYPTIRAHTSIATAPTTTRKTKNKGWTKGFLNRPTTKTKSTPAVTQQTPIPQIPLNSSTKHSIVATPAPSSTVLNDSDDTFQNKKVSFTGQDDVQVIPRIGQRSIASEQTSRLVIPNAHRNTTDAPFSSSSSSIDSSAAVASHVTEKKISSTRRRRPLPSSANTTTSSSIGRDDDDSNHSPIDHTHPMPMTTTDTTTAPTKKLSRFAQERRQLPTTARNSDEYSYHH